MEASDTAEIAFDNVEIPAENLMGGRERFSLYYATLCLGKVDYGYKWPPRAEYAIEYTIEYMSQREAFGKTIENSALRAYDS
jgi:alkylation response protein AidB-like acyl-CoA dehydrogenase